MKFTTSLFAILFTFAPLSDVAAQVVWTDPAFPRFNEPVTIYFDASQGTGGLEGYKGDIYIHTGLITTKSTTPNDWKYIKSEWGDNTNKATRLTRSQQDPDIYSLRIESIGAFYGVSGDGSDILRLAMVFRSMYADQNQVYLEGKTISCGAPSDIFIDLHDGSLAVKFVAPEDGSQILTLESSYTVQVAAYAPTQAPIASLEVFVNGAKVAGGTEPTMSHTLSSAGANDLLAIVTDASGARDSARASILIAPESVEQARPEGIQEGITYHPDDPTKATLVLLAPYKEAVFVIGEFNDWGYRPEYQMKRHTVAGDEVYWWLELSGLEPRRKYAFQYLVDGEIRIADPYAEEVLHPDDKYIAKETNPTMKAYPACQAEYVAVLQTDRPGFTWTDQDYVRPAVEDLVIYELLVRDFTAKHTFKAVIDSLDYLQRLGVNAIELMPVNEFEGNSSWGYNPAFYFAVDRYYGPSEDLKRLVNEAHRRGMAVILDKVYNHSFGQSPMVRLYNDGQYGAPTAQNIWFNREAKHPFNVGYDFNHESRFTQRFIDRVNDYWVREYKIDGFRYDLSKGFTQKYSGDVGSWNQYDQSRVDLLNRMKNELLRKHPGTYLILEHLGDNPEETALANSGFMLWGIMHAPYKEASLGFSTGSDLSGTSWKSRGWSNPHLVGYMESHDEERIMVDLLKYGNATAGPPAYDAKSLPTALDRVGLANAFLFGIPGPKMFWQFAEYGYDVSINFNGRTGEKPIRWSYLDNPDRRDLYEEMSRLIHLKTRVPAFGTTDFDLDVGGLVKRILLKDATDVQIVGNFDVARQNASLYGHNSGDGKWWYEYASRDSIFVSGSTPPVVSLAPGEYRIYSTAKLTADIALSQDTVRFAETDSDLNGSFTTTLSIANTGIQELIIENIVRKATVFNITPKTARIPVGGQMIFSVSFTPPSEGTFSDDLTIQMAEIGQKTLRVEGDFVLARLAPVDLSAPGDGASDVPVDVEFTWNAASFADQYHLQVAVANAGGVEGAFPDSLVFDADTLTGTSFAPGMLQTDTEYTWRVRALNAVEEGPWSSVWRFTTLTSPPDAVLGLVPASGTADVSTSPTLSWSAAQRAVSYDVDLAADPQFVLLVDSARSVQQTQTHFKGLTTSQTYYWRVRGVNTGGAGDWSTGSSFTTSTVVTPTLSSPADSAADLHQDSVRLGWDPVDGAVSYTLQLSSTADFAVKAEIEGIDTTHVQPANLEPARRYHWRIKAITTGVESAWSDSRAFFTRFGAPPAPVELMSTDRVSEEGGEILFNWADTSSAREFHHYHLEVSFTSAFDSLVFVDQKVDSTGRLVTADSSWADTELHWRVRSVNPSLAGPWSGVSRHTLRPALPGSPFLLSPADSTTGVSVEPMLMWSAFDPESSDAEAPALTGLTYEVQLSSDALFKQRLSFPSVKTDLLRPGTLRPGTWYFWRVRTTNATGTGPWSRVGSFRTRMNSPGVPIPIEPVSQSVTDPAATRFIWGRSEFTDLYHLQIGRIVEMDSTLVEEYGIDSLAFRTVVLDSSGFASQTLENIQLEGSSEFYWRVRGLNPEGAGLWSQGIAFTTKVATSVEWEQGEEGALPTAYALDQNHPNPFNPSTVITYSLPKASQVRLSVHTLSGQQVALLADGVQAAGRHRVTFDAGTLASGIYIYRLIAEDFVAVRKFTLIK